MKKTKKIKGDFNANVVAILVQVSLLRKLVLPWPVEGGYVDVTLWLTNHSNAISKKEQNEKLML